MGSARATPGSSRLRRPGKLQFPARRNAPSCPGGVLLCSGVVYSISMRRRQVTPEQVLAVMCPKCLREPNEPCVYVHQAIDPRWTYTESAKVAMARFGTPTKVPHPERSTAAYRAFFFSRVARQPMKPARIAMRDFEIDEYLALRAWFGANGSIFQSLQSAPCDQSRNSGPSASTLTATTSSWPLLLRS